MNAYFHCDADKSRAVSSWAYQVASSHGFKLWSAKDSFELTLSQLLQYNRTFDLVAENHNKYNKER